MALLAFFSAKLRFFKGPRTTLAGEVCPLLLSTSFGLPSVLHCSFGLLHLGSRRIFNLHNRAFYINLLRLCCTFSFAKIYIKYRINKFKKKLSKITITLISYNLCIFCFFYEQQMYFSVLSQN